MIKIQKLSKFYGGDEVVNIQELNIKRGEIIGIVGNNGAGKTTLFRLMLDLIRADSGVILSKEKNVAFTEEWKNYTAAYLDESFLINYLTPLEYFYFVGTLHKLSKAEVDVFLKKFEYFFEDEDFRKGKYIRDQSKGNQFKVGIIANLLQKPEILILDEPFANLDPSSQSRLIKILEDLNEKRKVTIIVSSHDLTHVTGLSKRILLMEKGQILKDLAVTSDTIFELAEYFNV